MRNKFSNNSKAEFPLLDPWKVNMGCWATDLIKKLWMIFPLLMIKSGVLSLVKLEHVSHLKESLFVNQFYQCYIVMNN